MFYYGASYYPEQETWEDIQKDAQSMRRAGFNITRMGEFAWIKFEPEEGRYEFEWLDKTVELLGQNGVSTLMCTPTANPPVWMVEKHPEILFVDNRGVTRPFGGRRHYCYNNPVYRSYCEKIAGAIGGHYGGNPNIIGFHLDNEFGHEGTGRCRCPVCQEAFRTWLEKKYGSIDVLNERMGAVFWSQTYQRFDQIKAPQRDIGWAARHFLDIFYDNPTLRIDFERYCSESGIGFLNIQRDAIRRHSGKPVTTNAVGLSGLINYYDAYGGLDIVAQDEYSPLRTQEMYATNHSYAFCRGLKRRNFWVVETRSGGGHCVWKREGYLQPRPGALRQHAVYTYACGAEVYNYFQMKTFRYGAEQMEAAVLNVDGVEGRRFREFQTVSALLPKLERYLTGTITNEAAVVYDYDSRWALEIKPIHHGFSYDSFNGQIHEALARAGYGCDVIPPGGDIFKYKLVILPAQIIMSEEYKRMLIEYVEKGGVLAATFITAQKDPDNNAPRELIPAGLCGLFGMRVAEGEPVYKDDEHDGDTTASVTLTIGEDSISGANLFWTESLEPDSAEVAGKYADTFRAGEAVATRNAYGEGAAYYLGCGLDGPSLAAFLSGVARGAGVHRAPFSLPGGVEAITREFDGKPLYCVFNFRNTGIMIDGEGEFRDILTGEAFAAAIPFPTKGFRFLQRERIN